MLVIARELLGKILVTNREGKVTSGRIVEVEAYAGIHDKASHASGGRITERNRVMYAKGGVAYVYLCYGIHHLFNIVTHEKDTPHAILIRAIEPLEGTDIMMRRTGRKVPDVSMTRGPGNLSKALGIDVSQSGISLSGREIYLADDGFEYSPLQIVCSPRIGVDYAGEDAFLPYRFYVKGSPYVSGKTK